MKTSDILTVKKTELHYWKACPCNVCATERIRRSKTPSIRLVPVSVAHALGFLPRRCKHGSLARQLTEAADGS